MKLVTALLVLLCSTTTLFAGAAPYFGLGLGGVAARDTDYTYTNGGSKQTGELQAGNGAVLDIAGGIDFDDVPLRFEGALSLLVSELDSVSYDSLGGISVPLDDSAMAVSSFMINGYFDFPTGSVLEPYVFAGLGTATVYHELSDEDVEDRVGAGQIGAGLGLVLTDFFIVDLKYRYFATRDYTVSNGDEKLESDFASHQFIGGFRVRF